MLIKIILVIIITQPLYCCIVPIEPWSSGNSGIKVESMLVEWEATLQYQWQKWQGILFVTIFAVATYTIVVNIIGWHWDHSNLSTCIRYMYKTSMNRTRQSMQIWHQYHWQQHTGYLTRWVFLSSQRARSIIHTSRSRAPQCTAIFVQTHFISVLTSIQWHRFAREMIYNAMRKWKCSYRI